MITIVCVLRSGGKVGYDGTWVSKLQNMLNRQITLPFRFVCLSDCEVSCDRISLLDTGPGYWSKLQLFRQGLFKGPTLYFDLDTVICGNLDPLIKSLIDQNNFVMWKDPDYKISSSAIMYWNGDYSHIWAEYDSNPTNFEQRYSVENQGAERMIGDQAVISTLQPHVFVNDMCPESWIHVAGKSDAQKNLKECRILIFRKANNKPNNKQDHPLVIKHWN
jgi:hypothetical protein